MLNSQRLLQKKKNQNTAENTSRAKKTRTRRTVVLSMAAISVIPFLAPPIGMDRSVFALAATGSVDQLLEGKEQAESVALLVGAIKENEEAAEYAKQAWKSVAENIYRNVFAPAEEELHLLGLAQQDELLEDDVVVDGSVGGLTAGRTQNAAADGAFAKKGAPVPDEFSEGYGDEREEKKLPDAEDAFFAGEDYSDIPAALSLDYNADYTTLKLSAEQLTVLETIVEAEAGDEDVYGKILVANVVLNRVLDDDFPDTVKEVVFQNNGKIYQFSPVRTGGRYYTVKVSKHTKTAVARALAGEDYSNGALYFFARRYTSEKKAKWFDTSLRKIVEYGCHEFFGNK